MTNYSRLADRPVDRPGGLADPAPLEGTWVNTYPKTTGIQQFQIYPAGDQWLLSVTAKNAPLDWGSVPITAYAATIDDQQCVAFHAIYDFGFMRSFLAANTNKGLIIIAAYNEFSDDSGRSNYFSREFYYRV